MNEPPYSGDNLPLLSKESWAAAYRAARAAIPILIKKRFLEEATILFRKADEYEQRSK